MIRDIIKRNNVTVHGEGTQVMLMAAGYGCDQNMWRFITPAYSSKYKIVLFDHVGSGKSDISAYDYKKYASLQGYADDIIEICESLNLKNVILLAHSVAAMMGLLAANKAPHLFEKFIMVCPSPRYINDETYYGGFEEADIHDLLESLESNYLGWSKDITPVIMGNADKPELSEELANSFCQNNPEIAKHFAKVTFLGDNRHDLSKLTTRTLILQCKSDVIAPEAVGKYVNEQLQNSTIVVMEATGHCPHMSAPKETVELVNKFLANI
ncbi:MAG: alpha/beta fold hydrolase [Flavobacterium sp.]|jgi:sigma-B regulation protein RsbQ